jgi:hypothetical protein
MAITQNELETHINNIQCGQATLGCNLVVALKTGSKKTLNLARKNTAVSNMLDIIYNYDTADTDENSITEEELLDIISFATTLVDRGCNC